MRVAIDKEDVIAVILAIAFSVIAVLVHLVW